MTSKRIGIRMTALFFALSVVIACSGGGGGGSDTTGNGTVADSMTISIDGGTVTSYVETPSAIVPIAFGMDPYIWTDYYSSKMHLYAMADWVGANYNYTTIVELRLAGTSPGAYPIASIGELYYQLPAGPRYSAYAAQPASSGTITVTRYDAAAGGKIQGTFDVTATFGSAIPPQTARLTGTFDVTRN